MATVGGLIARSEGFDVMTCGGLILDTVEDQMRAFGASHFLASGIPMPARPMEPLVLRMTWGDLRSPHGIRALDPAVQRAFRSRSATFWNEASDPPLEGESFLLSNFNPAGNRKLLVAPICAFLPYQAVVLAGGNALELNTKAMLSVSHFLVAAFRRLFAIGYLKPDRPGELSARERRVLELSAIGKTASEIAAILAISQRTVHAHLQNASEKLGGENKTHTVVEALRYGQISV